MSTMQLLGYLLGTAASVAHPALTTQRWEGNADVAVMCR